MQDNVRTPLDRAVASINRTIASDIVAAGDDNLSMGFLTNAFDSAIYAYVEKAGTQVQLAILSDPGLHGISMESAQVNGRDVATVIASTACEALIQKMRPKMVEMCRRIHKDRTLDTLTAIAALLDRASLENDPSFDHQALRDAAAFAGSVCSDGLPSDYRNQLAVLPEALKSLAARRKDKAFIARLGEPLEGIVRLANRASDLVQLDQVDPAGFRMSLETEVMARRQPGIQMAA